MKLTLSELLALAAPLRPEVAVRIVLQVCRTLTVAPSAFTTLGARWDLRPLGIVLEGSAEDGLKVALVRPGEVDPSAPMFLSPEQATNACAPDARSDVYALCMMLYQALSGTFPRSPCVTVRELVTALCTEDARPLADAAPWLTPGLVAVVERGLRPYPSDRWPSARELCEALLPFTGGSERLSLHELVRLGDGDRPRLTPAKAAPRRAALLLGAALLALSGGAILLRTILPKAAPAAPISSAIAPTTPPVDPSERAPSPPKREVFSRLIEHQSLFIHLDPRSSGVVVPGQFVKDSSLVLQVGKAMAIPIPDLEAGDAAISATLSFNRKPFHCTIPWSAVYALVGEDGKGWVWNDEVPPEVAAKMQKKPD